MKILVTGGAGYIGSVIVEELLRQGATVTVVDDLSQGHRGAVGPGATLEVAGLGDRGALDDVFSRCRPDAVIHLAAHSNVGESMKDPYTFLHDNVANGLNLFDAMVRHRVDRIVLSSTANVYGEPDKLPIRESAPAAPTSPYGLSKLTLERMLSWFEQIHGIRFAALRYFNAAGATRDHGEDHNPELHLIPLVLQVALGQRERITVYGDDYPTEDGTCVRDYVHVADLALAHLSALRQLERHSCTYNLGSSHGYSVKQVIETAIQITGYDIPVTIGARRPGDTAVLVASSEKLSIDTGWAAKRSLNDIVQSAWDWHRRHPDGYPD